MTLSFAHLLGQPVVIQGQKIVLVPDIIGSVPVTEQHEYVEIARATNTCASIYMKESDLEQVRQKYPRLPVYGLWQVLVSSQKVNFQTPLQIVPTTSFDGYYVHADVGRILYSGNYDAGFFAADTGFRLSNAVKIIGETHDLVLPKNPALLAREILSNKQKLYRGSILHGVIIVAVMCFIAFIIDFTLQVYSERDYASIVEKDNQLQKMTLNLKKLSKNRLIETPDQTRQLYRLALILNDFDSIESEDKIRLNAKTAVFIVSAVANPALLYNFVESEIQPDGRWRLVVDMRSELL